MSARLSEAEFAKLKGRSRPPSGHKRWQALGRLPRGTMNKTEREYADLLDQQKAAGEIIDYKFHPMRIRLADNTYYEVDFLVLHADQSLAIHETKGGFTSEKGQMKIKLVAELMPWFGFFKAVKQAKKDGGGFRLEDFSRGLSVAEIETIQKDAEQ
ncbi:hypothetical protein [Pseudomonas phage Itty13]|uniref:DUF1064 domain-containing protein n=1 Tax=Pseudomonas phage Itty13 TaxID=2805750 RepID=A0A889IR31_9CAUD|nr:hypothetical protein PQC19_gp59 [Pseudomonas phage Itty13]QRE00635.1 hypothetical protein [Pseudomonas phage Itty13]